MIHHQITKSDKDTLFSINLIGKQLNVYIIHMLSVTIRKQAIQQ